MNTIYLTECPRDAMQGIKEFIPTDLKLQYLQQLLKVGFDYLDYGSFVSPKAIPQMQDTSIITPQLHPQTTQLLAIIANVRGAQDALQFQQVTYLGFPLSVSEIFQQRNTNASVHEALERIKEIQTLCRQHHKHLRVYLSMAFGNPYNEEWNAEKVISMSEKLYAMGIRDIALADTIGCSTKENINYLFTELTKSLPDVKWIAHLHSTPDTAYEKVEAAYNSGCRYFDSALMGFGGCPMAKDQLTGNIATETILIFAEKNNVHLNINKDELQNAQKLAQQIFNQYH
ncbi:MAG: hydroxymethylglutaryl-CoA lyase [Bacteroidetes bacterium]|jgi:hydroxymethylglutaryl-CoA lyase|nr:MAG: hydroxymethylglutaryl-CoA lyase [Bacteroidota bacterium]